MLFVSGGYNREQSKRPPETFVRYNRIRDTGQRIMCATYCCINVTEIILYRLYRVIEKRKCSEGKRGVSGVSNVLLVNCINGFNQF